MEIPHITKLFVPQDISINRVLLDCSYGYGDCEDTSNDDESKSSYKILSSRNVILMSCSFAVIIIMVYMFLILRKYMLNRRRRTRILDQMNEDFVNENQGPELIHPIWFINTIGLQQSVIDSISIFTYKKDEVLVEGTDCSVCLSEFQEDERLRLLPKCSHAFHIPCIDTWLRAHKNCPLCRAPVVVETNNVDVSVRELGSDGLVANEGDLVNNIEVGNEQESVESVGDLAVLVEQGDISDDSRKRWSYFSARNVDVRVQSDLVDHVANMAVEFQQTRRSIYLDSSSASLIHFAVATDNCDGDRSKLKKVESRKGGSRPDSIYGMVTSSSFRRYFEKRPISMKRSYSASGKKVSKQRSSRSQDSILPF